MFPTGEHQRQTDDALRHFIKTKAKCEAKARKEVNLKKEIKETNKKKARKYDT